MRCPRAALSASPISSDRIGWKTTVAVVIRSTGWVTPRCMLTNAAAYHDWNTINFLYRKHTGQIELVKTSQIAGETRWEKDFNVALNWQGSFLEQLITFDGLKISSKAKKRFFNA